MKRDAGHQYEPAPYIPELRDKRGAVTVPCPTKEQVAAEDAQVALLEKALATASATKIDSFIGKPLP